MHRRIILNMSTQPALLMAYDGQIESLSKHQQLHGDVQHYGLSDNNAYCFLRREEVRERIRKGLTGLPPNLQLESRLGWMLLTPKVN